MPNNSRYITVGSSVFCECREHVYRDASNPWSLQNAILNATSCFLDKLQTENNWFTMLDPEYPTLPSTVLNSMINYAVYDCLNVTYLRLPATKRCPLKQLATTSISVLLADLEHIIANSDLEQVSEDEPPPTFHPSLSYSNQKNHEIVTEVLNAEVSFENPLSLNQNLSTPRFHGSEKTSTRSATAKARRNTKRSTIHRLNRYNIVYADIYIIYSS